MKNRISLSVFALLAIAALPLAVSAQVSPTKLTDPQVARLAPSSFYYQGQSAATQMRNTAAVKFGADHYVIAGLVDTSGYAADVRAKYEGFLIADLPITVNGSQLAVGAYGFGFSNDGKLLVTNIAGDELFSVSTTKDSVLKRPRPLMMTVDSNGVRLYSGRVYVAIAAQ